jgi:hypothetical protein
MNFPNVLLLREPQGWVSGYISLWVGMLTGGWVGVAGWHFLVCGSCRAEDGWLRAVDSAQLVHLKGEAVKLLLQVMPL